MFNARSVVAAAGVAVGCVFFMVGCAEDAERSSGLGDDEVAQVADPTLRFSTRDGTYSCSCTGSDGVKRSYVKEVSGGTLVAETRPCDRNGVCSYVGR